MKLRVSGISFMDPCERRAPGVRALCTEEDQGQGQPGDFRVAGRGRGEGVLSGAPGRRCEQGTCRGSTPTELARL